MKKTALLLAAVFVVGACGSSAPVLKVDDLYAEREKSKAEFHKKYAGKEVVVAGTYKDGQPKFDFKNNSKGYEELNVMGSSFWLVHCLVEEKDAAGFASLKGGGEGIAVKGEVVSAENDAYVELRPCTMDLRK
jgi:hypothetical protein